MQNFKIVFILFKIISELENIKQDDVDLEEGPQHQSARIDQEINPETLAKDSEFMRLLEESPAARAGNYWYLEACRKS